MKKILLLGMGPSALSALNSLANRFQVLGVIRDVSGNPHTADEVEERARALKIPFLPDVRLEYVKKSIVSMGPDCVVASSYNRILSPEILTLCKFVNVHHARLPQYRGRVPINWYIINGEKEAAISVHVMSPDVDAGSILYQEAIRIEADDTAFDVLSKLNSIQYKVLGDTVARYLAGDVGRSQNESDSTYCCARIPADGEIDWSQSTDQIYAQIRALSPPWPGAYSYLQTRRITIVQAKPVPEGYRYVGRIPGRVVRRSQSAGFVDVLTGDGILRICEVAVDAGRVVPAATEITSTTQTLGMRASDLLARIQELERWRDTHDCGRPATVE